MNYKEAFLESASGYMMPFSVEENEEVKIILPYGEQMHPTKGVKFFHHGVDFAVKEKPLYAMATGMVIGVTIRNTSWFAMGSMMLHTRIFPHRMSLMVKL